MASKVKLAAFLQLPSGLQVTAEMHNLVTVCQECVGFAGRNLILIQRELHRELHYPGKEPDEEPEAQASGQPSCSWKG